MVLTRSMAKQSASKGDNGSNNSPADTTDASVNTASCRDAERAVANDRGLIHIKVSKGHDAPKPQIPKGRSSSDARPSAAVPKTTGARRGRKTSPSQKPRPTKKATDKTGGLKPASTTDSLVKDITDHPLDVPSFNQRTKRPREDEGNKENEVISEQELSPSNARRIRQRTTKAPIDENSAKAASGSSNTGSSSIADNAAESSDEAIAISALLQLSPAEKRMDTLGSSAPISLVKDRSALTSQRTSSPSKQETIWIFKGMKFKGMKPPEIKLFMTLLELSKTDLCK
ncbi:hypothetical protein ACEPAF_1736 [Sanghuangporus sanghuang]